jgi:hypothetical protein
MLPHFNAAVNSGLCRLEGESTYLTFGDNEIGEEDWPHVLIDGHNRYEICHRLGIQFQTVRKQFESRDDAIEWIINNQFGRRNLSDYRCFQQSF